MLNSYLSDRIFNSHRTIMDSFSCIHFLWKLHLTFHMHYYINITLKYLHFRSRHDQFGFYLWRLCRNIWQKMMSKSDVMTSKQMCDVKKSPWRHARESSYTPSPHLTDVMTSKLMCDIKKTPWHHAWESSYTPSVRWHFLALVGFTEIPEMQENRIQHP